eukprot:TRINITY_DN12730_c0_g1_i1.p1 TRINITY_DN12730_c0_g1~~TRINITY_DN12730_c0_g1_i1.p1  ORF type:complete len:1045 (-),score=252.09 TRINITY_DN12730_c0_g1_i1:1063-4197(-)
MRISTAQIFSQTLDQMNSAMNDVSKLTMMQTSQKKVNSPSDDPSGMGTMVELSSFTQALGGYVDNCSIANEHLGVADKVLVTASEQLTAAEELLSQASSETYTPEQLKMMALELDGYFDSLYAIANTQVGVDSIFSGDDTADNAYEMGLGVTLPNDSLTNADFVALTGEIDSTLYVRFDSSGTVGTDALNYRYSSDGGESWTTGALAAGDTTLNLGDCQVELVSGTAVTTADDDGNGTQFYVRETAVYTGSNKAMSAQISENTSVDMNTVGSSIFGGVEESSTQAYESPNMFETLSDCIVYMEIGDHEKVAECLEELKSCHEYVEAGAANIGARENTVSYTQTSVSLVKELANNSISSIEDANAAQLIVELEQANYIYQAVLKSSSTIMSTSLLDYIQEDVMGYVSSLSSNVTAYTPVTTSGEVTFSGLGNGTDFDEIIDATISSESSQLNSYNEKKTENAYIVEQLESLKDAIDDFNKTLDKMDEPDEFYSMEASVTGDDEVIVTADEGAEMGMHTIVVNQLAQTDVWVNTQTAYASDDTVVASAATTLTVDCQGETITIDVTAGTTLEGLVSTINGNVNARDKFEASIMNDGSASYLVLTSAEAGSNNTLTITGTGSLTGMSTAGFTNTQVGQSSQIKVDGFPPGANDWIERDSNSIDDVVDGLTFDLKDTTDGKTRQISITYDADEMSETITEFTEELNQIILDIQLLTGRVTEEEDPDEEAYTIDSYALDIVYNQIKSILSSSALGFKRYDETEGGDYYTALSQIGFETDTDEGSDTYGQLILDEDELEEALEKDPLAVAAMFAARSEGESDSDGFQVISIIDGVTPAGEIEVKYTVSGGVLVSATIDGEAAEVDGWTILGTGSKSKGLYLAVSDQGDGDFEGTARVKQGKICQLSEYLDSVTVADTGSLTLLIESYEETGTSLDNQIYSEEKRLDALETSLKRRYSALDATLSTYSNQSSMLTTMLSSLTKTSSQPFRRGLAPPPAGRRKKVKNKGRPKATTAQVSGCENQGKLPCLAPWEDRHVQKERERHMADTRRS